MNQEKERTIVIDLLLTGRTVTVLILGLLAFCFVAYLAWGETGISSADGQASGAMWASASSGMRQFYLSQSSHNAVGADAACEPGYHMASMWEVLDPSNLRYNPDLGQSYLDTGEGPPADTGGWIRTGGSSSGLIPGYANCDGYSSAAPGDNGTVVWLDTSWDQTQASIHVWEASTWSCAAVAPVWCVED